MVLSDVRIRYFQAGDERAFRELNEAWITKYFEMEEADRALLNDPDEYVLRWGGRIFMAIMDGKTVGTCALVFKRPGSYEVVKMAVAEEYRGLGIGRGLLEHAIAEAKASGARWLSLETNAKLKNAIHLYESVGFKHLPPERVTPSPYTRANVFMEMEL
jgi:putative acetyltransferase